MRHQYKWGEGEKSNHRAQKPTPQEQNNLKMHVENMNEEQLQQAMEIAEDPSNVTIIYNNGNDDNYHTSRERLKLASYLRLKTVKNGTLRALSSSSWLQNMKKFEGGTLWGLEKLLPKSLKNEIFEQCHSAEKCKMVDSLGF